MDLAAGKPQTYLRSYFFSPEAADRDALETVEDGEGLNTVNAPLFYYTPFYFYFPEILP